MKIRIQFFFMLLISGCIGTDYLEDPIVGSRIEVLPGNGALMPTQSLQLTASYFDSYGHAQNVAVSWNSSANNIATVDANGLVTAQSVGQATITAGYETILSAAIQITVVVDENAVASVTLSSPHTALESGEQVEIAAVVKNINGELLTDRTVEWFTENATIVTVDAAGKVTGKANGIAGIHAKVEGVKSNSINFSIGSARSASFMSAGGYSAVGTATLKMDNKDVILELSTDFTTSFALGTFIYLSNTTSGSGTHSNGFEVAQIFANGAKQFNISAVDSSVGLYDYRYVIILCKPARVTFGYADFN